MLACLKPAYPTLLLAVLLSACSTPQAPEPPPVVVRTEALQAAPEAIELSFPAVLRSSSRLRLAAQVPGLIGERPVQLGDRVQAGQVLARLSTPGLDPARRAADAATDALAAEARQAAQDLERVRELRQRQLVSEDQLEQARTRLERSQAALAQARAQGLAAAATAAEQLLHAPADGEVVRIHVEPGEFVAAGQAVLELALGTEQDIELALPARLANRLAIGSQARIVDLDGKHIGTAQLVGLPAAGVGPGGLVRTRWLPELSGSWPPGTPLELLIRMPVQAHAEVPLSALRAPGGVPPARLYHVVDGRVAPVAVELVALNAERALVTVDLPLGSEVIVAGPGTLLAGDLVRSLK